MEGLLRQKLHGSWDEVKVIAPGLNPLPDNVRIWWNLDHKEATEVYDSGQVETSRYSVHLTLRANPARMDLSYHDNDRHRVMLGLLKFDGERLIWIAGDYVDYDVWLMAKGCPPGRPNGFAATKENKYVLRVLERSK